MKMLFAADGSKDSLNAPPGLIEPAGGCKETPRDCLTYMHLSVQKVGGSGRGQSKGALANKVLNNATVPVMAVR